MGGQRCPKHAGERLARRQERLGAVQAAHAAGQASPDRVQSAHKANWDALVEYASTVKGAGVLRAQLDGYPDQNGSHAQMLRTALNNGALLAQSNREVENQWRASRGKGPLATVTPLTFEQQAAESAQVAERAAADAVKAADPLGLRAVETAQMPVVAVPPVVRSLPTAPPQVPVAGLRPGLPTARPSGRPSGQTGLPTRAPAAASAGVATLDRPDGDEVQQARAALAAREADLATERAARQRAEKAAAQAQAAQAAQALAARTKIQEAKRAATAQVQEVRAEVRTQSQQARAMATARNAEVRRLKATTTKDAQRNAQWARGEALKPGVVPAGTWDGPGRWQGGQRATMAQNRAALKQGVAVFGDWFEDLVVRNAGNYSPSEVLEACAAVRNTGYIKMTGQDEVGQGYTNYQQVDRHTIGVARRAAYAAELGTREAGVLSKRYALSNTNAVLDRALRSQPTGIKAQRGRIGDRFTRVYTQQVLLRAARLERVLARFANQP